MARFGFFRTLRFRLASMFLVFLTVILATVGFIGTSDLKYILENQNEETLREELTALKGYIYFDKSSNMPIWSVDRDDPDDVAEITRLRRVFVLARPDGRVYDATNDAGFESLSHSKTIAQDIGQIKAQKAPLFKTIQGDEDGPYRIIASVLPDNRQHDWYLAVGRSLSGANQIVKRFRRNYLIFFPLAILLCTMVSWYSAGRALLTLGSVERAAQDITGSNLGLQIPQRGAGDELDRLIGSFNEMSRRLKASFDQIRQFSTDVSHELRTPLTAIQGQLEVALFTAKKPEQLREAIENALQDVERLSKLIRALLLLAQAESGQLPMVKGPVEVGAMTAFLIEQFQIPAEVHELKLTCNVSADLWCDIDRTQMERVITNLLSNSMKYTPAGGTIEATVERIRAYVRIRIADTGVGISADHLPHIFDRFYRVPDPNPEKGLGLGLSFVASIVKAHNGKIEVVSDKGQGTRFDVYLPAGASARTPVLTT